jgi:alpha-N-arabinofuranosidase
MIGLERNADVVYLSSYAPLFAHVEAWQWTPDLIWFDNLRSYGTPNYYVQKLFATNRGTQVLSLLHEQKPVAGQEQLYATAALDQTVREVILKIVNASGKVQKREVMLEGGKLNPRASLIVLTHEKKEAVNSLDDPAQVRPLEESLAVKGKKLSLSLPPYSLTIVRVGVER